MREGRRRRGGGKRRGENKNGGGGDEVGWRRETGTEEMEMR